VVVAAIEAERINADSSGIIELRQLKANKLNTVPVNNILNILRDLEAGHKIIKIVKENRPSSKSKDWPQLYDAREAAHAALNSSISFSLQILDEYEAWFADYSDTKTDKPKTTSPRKPVLRLPAGARWEDITIKFIDGHNVDIRYKGKNYRSDFKEMGFEDLKSRKPNKQWDLLQRLAENNGEIAWDGLAAGKSSDISKTEQDFGYEFDEDDTGNKGFSIIKAPDKLKKTKQLLSQALKRFFKIDSDPFFPYDEVKAYKVRLKLTA
jgi:hypothetical protein